MKYRYADHIPFYQKLNFNCPKSYKDGEGEGSCKGYKSGSQETVDAKQKSISNKQSPQKEPSKSKSIISSKQDYKSASNEDKLAFLESEIAKGKKSTLLPDGTFINNLSKRTKDIKKKIGSVKLTSPSQPTGSKKDIIIKKTRSILSKVKSEKAKTGKVSKQSIQDLRKSITNLKNELPKPNLTTSSSSGLSKSKDNKESLSSSVTPKSKLFHKSVEYKSLVTDSNKLILSKPEFESSMKKYITDSSRINKSLIKYNSVVTNNKSPTQILEETDYAMSFKEVEAIQNLDKLISSSNIPIDMTTYSGISKELFDKINNSKSDTFENSCFISTSANKKVAEGFSEYRNKSSSNGYMLEVRMPKGSNALAVDDYTTSQLGKDMEFTVGENGKFFTGGHQHEVMLGRNSKFKIIETKTETLGSKQYNTDMEFKVIVVELI